MNLNKQQSALLGMFFIVLGLVWWLELWWLLIPGLLIGGGIHVYRKRRQLGRTIEAVQSGVWLVGLGALWLIDSIWPGILFLAGASLLLRGREDQFNTWLQRWAGYGRQAGVQVYQRRGRGQAISTQQVPITTQNIAATASSPASLPQSPTTGETTRLTE